MNISLSHILYVLLIFQLLFLSIFLLTQLKGKRISNVLLGLFFLSISLNLLDFFLNQIRAYTTRTWLAGWGSCLPLVFGPLIYLYTQSVLNEKYVFKAKKWVHFIPFLVVCAGTEVYFLSRSSGDQQRLLENLIGHRIPLAVSIVSNLIFIQFLLYIITSFRLVSRYRTMAKQFISNREQHNIRWLYSMIRFYLLIVIMSIVNGLLAQTALASYCLVFFNGIVFAMLIFVLTVFLKALQIPYFFSFSEETEPGALTKVSISTQVPEAERLDRERIVQRVLDYMEKDKPFMEPELTLDQLSGLLSVKPRALSQAINEGLGQNFYDFVNRYRIREATRLLTHPKDSKITILEVLYEVGFNSKSSFNTLFKKYTGLTPSEFRKKQF
jgi:AraC-like DNA-binding protein